MYLENLIYCKICESLCLEPTSKQNGLEKLKKSISMLHNTYLIGSCKEAGVMIKKYPNKSIDDIFDFVISIYNKRIKNHHSLFLVIHFFETALRSKIAIILSNKFSSNQNCDDWFYNGTNHKLIKKAKHIANIKKTELVNSMNSFEVLDLFTLGDLENLIKENWSDFKYIFADKAIYNNQALPEYGTKERLLQTFSMIRKSRNDIFHNNPPKTKAKSIITNVEILLLRLGFNINDAF
ncbi:hypothetical protein [Campylobacter pinnipediorum]|uniref:hypothetical protein n=1 Tax=Campylobacter pinnipediorum TaxID=1965231 RepID=UPI00084D1B3A|nr:hypothetical protein [Campylobacter pinnipediorum]